MTRNILHIDINNCFASIECLLNPSLKDKPVAVTGNILERKGIILAKNEKAKSFGVVTAEAIWEAKKKCPDLVIVPPHYDIYLNFSKKLRAIYERYTDRIEPFSIDECWLDVTGTRRDIKEVADEIRETIKRELGITVSVGASFNKIFAKLGSDMKKPDGTTVISRENFKSTIWCLPASDLLFIGPATKKVLKNHGIQTIGQLAETPVRSLDSWLGKRGKMLWEYANGYENSPVNFIWQKAPVKSVSNGTTAFVDLNCIEDVKMLISALSEKVASRLRRLRLKGGNISIAVKNADFKTFSAQCKIYAPTSDGAEIAYRAAELFEEHYSFSESFSVRSVTVGVSSLCDEDSAFQLDIYTSPDRLKKREALNKAMDQIRDRYGYTSINRAAAAGGRHLFSV